MLRLHWRLIAGPLLGVMAWWLAGRFGAPAETLPLVGWNAGAAAYVALIWVMFVRTSEADLRSRAAVDDETVGVMLTLVVLAVAAALAGIVLALLAVRDQTPAQRAEVAALAVMTMVTSWLVLQSVFAVHYAHRHFQAVEASGEGHGFIFPGEPARTYLDFVYLAYCVGATAQVSDPGVGVTRLRNLVTTHAAIAFFYNTAVLALGINIVASLIGR